MRISNPRTTVGPARSKDAVDIHVVRPRRAHRMPNALLENGGQILDRCVTRGIRGVNQRDLKSSESGMLKGFQVC